METRINSVEQQSENSSSKQNQNPQQQSPKHKRNKLKRSTESFGNAFENSYNGKNQTATTITVTTITPPTTTTITIATTSSENITSNCKTKHNQVKEAEEEEKSKSVCTKNVMGGGFTAPPAATTITKTALQQLSANNLHNKNAKKTAEQEGEEEKQTVLKFEIKPTVAAQMHEKLIEKDETIRKEKTDKFKLLSTSSSSSTSKDRVKEKDKEKEKEKEKEKHSKPHKESTTNRLADRLRRSFRRGEHKSFEHKRTSDKTDELQAAKSRTTPPPQASSTAAGAASADNNNFLSGKPLKKHRSRSSIFSLSNLPGLGGHINPALLLDSPDESTPPEYAYQNLSSVATTNSSTSLESNFDFSEVNSGSQTSVYYWAWQQQASVAGAGASAGATTSVTASTTPPAMGGEVSTNVSSSDSQHERTKRRLETQHSNRSAEAAAQQQQQQQQMPPVLGSTTHATASRSCSITSESSSVKLTRLQNFLFKSSNESTRSYQGHSNEGFTASSHNSSSGEWEQLGAYGTTNTSSSGGGGGGGSGSGLGGGGTCADFHVGSFPEESVSDIADLPMNDGAAGNTTMESSGAGSYYQYTLTSPNNPFLPEITARTYHSTYDEDLHEVAEDDEEEQLDGNLTSVKYCIGGGGSRSTQLPTPTYSRAGSQESTHSESGISCPHAPTPSPASSSSSTPGRHKRKLFSLNSPTRLLHHQHQHHQQQQHQQHQQQQQPQQRPQNVAMSGAPCSSSPPMSAASSAPTETSKFNSANLVRSLNPFLPISSVGSSPKRAPLKQSAVTSPVAVPPDLHAKREEFLRATMKICLVVSPPTSKLQLKSKSLTHLDGLDSMIACQHGPATTTTVATTTPAAAAAASSMTATSGRQYQQQQQQHQQQAYVQVEKSLRPSDNNPTRETGRTNPNTQIPHQQHSQTRPPTIYTQAPQQQHPQIQQQEQQPPNRVLSPTIVSNSCYQNSGGSGGGGGGSSGKNNTSSSSIVSGHVKHSHFSHQKQQHYSSIITSSTEGVPPPPLSTSSLSFLSSATKTTTTTTTTHHNHHYNSSSSNNNNNNNKATHTNVQQQFQSNIESAVMASIANTLSPALACSTTPTSAGGSTTSVFYYGSGAATPIPTPTSTSLANVLTAPTPTSATATTTTKKKSSFMTRKKPLLTRSEVSSSEYFSVNFCLESNGSGGGSFGGGSSSSCHDEEFIPAMKGVTLFTALAPALRKRGYTFSQINITDNNPTPSFLDAGISPLASSLDENTEVENLAGHHLIVTERESSRKTLQKAASFGSRTRPPRLLSSASTEETSESGAPSGKQIKQRWSGLFGTKNPSQSQLCELLNNYAKNGVPQRTAALNFSHPDFDAAVAYIDNMHKSWWDFVDSEGMSDSEVKIQTAIWELVTTEIYYIHALQTVTDLFLACLEAVQDERLLTDVDQHKLFSNVRDICEANLKFWTIYLYPMVAHSVATREPLRCAFFQDGFVNFASIFAPYKKYCAEQSTCQFYCKELNRTNALFTSYLAWCESQKMCNRLRLADIIVRPMQRLTKYSLLLAAIKKHMSDVDGIEAVDTMLHSVENFVCSVNNHLTMRQENERLKGVMARIESYDAVDTNNEQLDKLIKHYSQMFDLCAPMKGCPAHQVRHLFMEGDHKYKDNLGKADVHCFLLTDMLLVCKTIAKKGLGTLKVIRQPYLTDRLMVNMAPNNSNTLNCVYLNEFQVAVTAFTLQCLEAKNWYEALRRAKLIYTRLKQGTSGNWGDLRFGGSSTSAGNADSLGVKKSPMNSSICSHVSSANNSHSGSVEWNDSRNISVDFEKTNSLSSDEGSSLMIGAHHAALKNKQIISSQHKLKIANASSSSANTLSVQPLNHLGQSLPNLNLHHSHTNLYHTYSNNTLLVPGTTSSHSGNLLLSPSHRGISYPPPSPTRVPLRRGMAFSTSTKNPPLIKTRNITSQNSINWHQIPATPTPPSPQSQNNSPGINAVSGSNVGIGMVGGGSSKGVGVGVGVVGLQKSLPALITNNLDQAMQQKLQLQQQHQQQQQPAIQLSNQNLTEQLTSNETDV